METTTKVGLYSLMAGLSGAYIVNEPGILRLFYWAGVNPPDERYALALVGFGAGMAMLDFTPDRIKSRRYEKIFKSIGLKIKEDGKEYLPKLVEGFKSKDKKTERLLFALPKGLSSEDFKKKETAIMEALKAEEIEMRYVKGKVEVILKRNILLERYPFELIETKGVTEIVIGHSKDGFETLSLGDSYVHLLVGGLTGYGKSTFLLCVLTTLVLTKNPMELRIYLSDMKQVDLPVFERCPHVEMYVDTVDETITMLKEVRRVMYERLKTLKKAGINHINEYRGKMPRVIAVIDELACLIGNKEAYGLLKDVASKSRAVGIHLMLCTQRPDADVIPGLLKAQLPATLAFRTRNIVNSQILLDNKNASELTVKGRALLQTDREREVQVMYITPERARKLIKHLYIKREEKQEVGTSGVVSLDYIEGLAGS